MKSNKDSRVGGKVPKIEIHAVSVRDDIAISRDRNGHLLYNVLLQD
ncbi:MAG: hypothetical protein ACYCSW_00530 [bacterium]